MEEYELINWDQENNEERKAKASYYLLTHIDKGEFSQSLADHLVSKNKTLAVPDYIRKAVVWACGGQPDDP